MSTQAAPPLEKPRRAGRRKPPSAALYEVVVPLLATAMAFLVWEAICQAFKVPAYLVPPPSAIWNDTLAIGPTVLGHSLATLKTVLLGFLFSIAISLPLAVLLTASPAIASAIYPFLVWTQSVPKVALAPNVGIGTDGASCSDNQNMYENMRLASMVSKVQGPDNRLWITTEEVLHAATAGSARALRLGDRIGKLEAGYKADIVFLDLGNINWIPLNDPTNQIVHTEDGSGVHSVMIGGRMVMENRKLLLIDIAKVAKQAEQARERLAKGRKPAKALYDKLEKIVNTFCPGLAKQPLHIDRFGGAHFHYGKGDGHGHAH